MNKTVFVLALVAGGACAAEAVPHLRTDFPGGNGTLAAVDAETRVATIVPEPKGGSGYYWFNVEARDFAPGKWLFKGVRLTKAGPAVSEDGGATWRFLHPNGDSEFKSFEYTFKEGKRPVRFALAIPYQLADWERFSAPLRSRSEVRLGTLCADRSDADVPLLEIGCAEKPEWTFVFTARHHCCEVSASPVLEGLIEEALADSTEGRWVREHARVVCVPFMDLDGVEAGDQGKRRPPHDHNRDYVQEIYPTVKALKALAKGRLSDAKLYYVDLHSPDLRDHEHDHFYALGPSGTGPGEIWSAYRHSLSELTKDAALKYEPKWDIPWGRPWNNAQHFAGDGTLLNSKGFFASLPNCRMSLCMEYGYGLCGGLFSREAARQLGRNTLKAVVRSLRADRKGFFPVEFPAQAVEAVVDTVKGKSPSLLPRGTDWKLVWHDEFDQKEIDRTKWLCRESFWGADFPAFSHDYEGVEMTGETVKLKLLQKGDDFTSPHLQTGSLTYDIPKEGTKGFWPFGRRVKPTFMHKYGYWEIRCKINKCNGWHSAFWLQAPGVGSHPDAATAGLEVDVMESWMLRSERMAKQFGEGRGCIVGGIIAGGYGSDGGGFGHFAWPHVETADEWHTYGCSWSPDGYEFYCDGRKIGEQNWPVSHVEEFMLVSTEPGGYRRVGNDGGLTANRSSRTWGKPLPGLKFAAAANDCFEVDYVRVYDNAAGYGARIETLPLVAVPPVDPVQADRRAEELYLRVNRLTTLSPEEAVNAVSEQDLLRLSSEAAALDAVTLRDPHAHDWMKSVRISCAKLMRDRRRLPCVPAASASSFVKEAVRPFVESGECPGLVSILCRGTNEEVTCVGWADVDKRRPIALDQPYMACSQTKGVCGVAAAILVDDGKLALDDPVSKYLPVYRTLRVEAGYTNGCQLIRRAKNVMTVRHLLTHTSGLDFESPVFGKEKLGWTACSPKVNAYVGAAIPLRREPGTKFAYSNLGMNVAAAVIEVAAGMPFEKFLEERLFRPLGMVDTTFNPTDEQLARAIQLYEVQPGEKATWRADIYTMPLPHNGKGIFPSAGAGLWTTARDFSRFYKMLMNRGVGENGVRILKEGTVRDILETKQTPEGVETNYSLGFFIEKGGWWGHGGAWGTDALVNPELKAMKFLVQQMHSAGSGKDRPWPWEKAFYSAADTFMRETTKGSTYLKDVAGKNTSDKR